MQNLTIDKAALNEWSQAQRGIQDQIQMILLNHGGGEAILGYVRDMKGYPRVPYFSAAWVPDPDQRMYLGQNFCMHAVGIKLLDDIIDDDQDIPPKELVLGHILVQKSLCNIQILSPSLDVGNFSLKEWEPIWRHATAEPDTKILSIEQWFEGAEIKAGWMMAFYGNLCCDAIKNGKENLDIFKEALTIVGIIYMVGDDIRDWHTLGERNSNLFEMVRHSAPAKARAKSITQNYWDRLSVCVERKPLAFDFMPEVSRIYNKWNEFLS